MAWSRGNPGSGFTGTEDTIEEKIVKCNVAKMELDYKFGGQTLSLGLNYHSGPLQYTVYMILCCIVLPMVMVTPN